MAGKGTYIARGKQSWNTVKTAVFNIDNGSGTTIDDILLSDLPFDIELQEVRAVYTEATDTSGVATANFKLGTTVGGSDLVAATAYEVSKAIGSATSATIVVARVAAGGMLTCRHTGRAATEAGQAYVQVVYRVTSA